MNGATETNTSNDGRPRQSSIDYIKRVVDLIHEPKSIVELRCPKTHWKTISGYFSEYGKLAQEAAELSGQVAGVYITLNPVKPDLLARRANRIERHADQTTSDDDILKRRWLPIDFDPVRPAGISSTDTEKALSVTRAEKCRAWLLSLGFPAGVSADSGNGAHLLYRVDLPNNPASSELIQKCLEAVAVWFTDDKVSVDQKNFNAGRIWKLFGTMAAKGDDTKDRPHRLSKILTLPKSLGIVSLELLQKLATFAPEAQKHQSANNGHYQPFNLDDFIARHGIQVKRESAWKDGRRIILETCPWNPDHDQGEAFIVQFANGAISAGCQHNSCSYNKWPELREIYDPGYRDRSRSNEQKSSDKAQAKTAEQVPSEPVLIRLSTVQSKPIRWVWHGRIPLAKVTVLDGDPGLAKSLLSVDLAACLTTAKPMPNSARAELSESAGVVFLSAEDDPDDTIRPRFDLAGGDPERVVLLQAIKREGGLCLPTIQDLDALRIAVKDVSAKLIVIDPLMAYLGTETDSYRDQDVRRSLAPLAALARELEVAILLIRHLNKNGASNPLYRGGGSIGIIGAARSGLLVTKDPDDESKFVLSVTKTNIAKMPPSLSYSVKANAVEIPFITWHGTTQHTAASLLNDQADGNAGDRSAVKEAEDFLNEYLKIGARDVPDIFKEARKAGIADKTLRRGKSRLAVRARKSTFKEGWVWELTKVANPAEDGQKGDS